MSENKNVSSSLHYPKARVILGFLLMGGGLGGWLFWATLGLYNALGWYGQEAWQGSGDFVDLVPGFFYWAPYSVLYHPFCAAGG